MTAETAESMRGFYAKIRRAANGRAVFAAEWRLMSGFGIGMGMYPVLCVLYPEEIGKIHAYRAQCCVHNVRTLLPLIKDDIDILLISADDWGTQSSLVAAPEVYRTLFKPHYTMINDAIHEVAPNVKTFMHTCGAVYDLIEPFADSGFDILNPVQWNAGGHSAADWKRRAAAKRMALWGGGVDTQRTLPFGTVADVEREAGELARTLGAGGGYVYCGIHNLLAEVDPLKIIAMYRAAGAAM